MFACLYVPPRAGDEAVTSVLLDVARTVSPRVSVHSRRQILIDIEGLERLVGDPRAIGERLRQAAADRGIAPVHVAVAGTCTAAMLLAAARAGVTVTPAGGEAAALAPLPLRTLAVFGEGAGGWELGAGRGSQKPQEAVSRQYSGASRGAEARSQKPEARRRNATPESRIPNPESRKLAPGAQPLAPGPQSPAPSPQSLVILSRWGLRTLGELAALPAADLSERLGQDGIRWQRLARGEDTGPLVPAPEEEPFEASLELEWPITDLESLSFVLARLLDPLCRRLESRDRGAAVLHLRLRLVTRDLHLRSLQLPSPMRDPKVLRTLLLLDLESHPAPTGIDAVTLAIAPTPGRIVQESLLTRALPAPELISTLVARLQALMGEGKCGSPVRVDSYRPGAFGMAPFVVEAKASTSILNPAPERRTLSERGVHTRVEGRVPSPEPRELAPSAQPLAPGLRRFRLPIPARVLIDGSRPVSVRTDRPALAGGRVCASAGPWRTSGEWWKAPAAPAGAQPATPPRRAGWNRDEWDVALSDGGLYRIFEDRDTGRWFVGAVVD